jgi:hypothetical protein
MAVRDFTQFAAKLKGDEMREAQTFLFHLVAPFAHVPNNLNEMKNRFSLSRAALVNRRGVEK